MLCVRNPEIRGTCVIQTSVLALCCASKPPGRCEKMFIVYLFEVSCATCWRNQGTSLSKLN